MLVVRYTGKPLLAVDTPAVRDGGATEIKGRPTSGTNDLDLVGVEEVVEAFEGLGEGGNLDGRVGKPVDEGFHLGREDKRLIALDVHHDIEVPAEPLTDAGIGLVTTVGAATMGGGRHDGMPAKALHGPADTFVIRGNVNVRGNGRGFLVNVLHHRFAADEGEGLAGKTGGSVAGRD